MYTGFHPSSNWTPQRIRSINPKELYKKYVSTRTPVILTSFPAGVDYSWLSIENLAERVGNRVVQVEKKQNGTFGNGGTRKEMKFSEFVAELPSSDLYLTTQYSESLKSSKREAKDDEEEDIEILSESDVSVVDEEEMLLETFAAPPLDGLLPDIPHELKIFNGMVLHQMNLWIGHADEKGSTSGLHFDFHDNFYFLKQGNKRFTIFSPKDAENLHLHGPIREIHPNGLIQFDNGEQIRSDGAFKIDVGRWKVEKAEERLENAETEAETILAEADLETVVIFNQAMQELLDANGEEDEIDELEEHPKKKQKLDDIPPSFCHIPADALHDEVKAKKFPNLKKVTKVSFDLEPGEVLFLPAGWFHEVRSYGTSEEKNHLALNYWLAPPVTDDPDSPYVDDFWKETRMDPILHELKVLREEEDEEDV
jgi:hypothetical protein